MTDHRAWAKMLAEKALARFGARVWFMGLQGSVRRGAATESSDIDFVLILDRLDTADLSAYRELVRSMPDSEKACGFVSGRKELLAWPRADLFQFYHDTEALYGSLSEVGALLCPQDARGALHMGAANVYHAACHSFLFEDASANLPALYKAAFFVLQAQAFAASGVYCEDAAALERHLPDADSRAVLAGRGQKAFTPQEAPEHYALLVRWAGAVLRASAVGQDARDAVNSRINGLQKQPSEETFLARFLKEA